MHGQVNSSPPLIMFQSLSEEILIYVIIHIYIEYDINIYIRIFLIPNLFIVKFRVLSTIICALLYMNRVGT